MRIGILTFHRPINYGAFLQAYGLSTKLAECYPEADVEIIDYIAPLERKKIYRNVLRRLKRNGIKGAWSELVKIRVFKKALANLALSECFLHDADLQNLFRYIEENYDMLVIGSDAVFNWNQNGYPTAYIPDYSFSIPVFTYAVSAHGLRYFSEIPERIRQCGKTFGEMRRVFVRDECTKSFVEFCNKQVECHHVCDPSFLIDFAKLYQIKHRSIDELKRKYRIKGEYIVLMLQNEGISRRVYEKYRDQYTIVSLFTPNKYADCFMYDLSPVEWCLLLKYSRTVVTSFFHGTLLSLQQSVPAVVVDISEYDGEYEGKLDDLMNRRIQIPELYFSGKSWEDKQDAFWDAMEKSLNGKYLDDINSGVMRERATFQTFMESISDVTGGNNE